MKKIEFAVYFSGVLLFLLLFPGHSFAQAGPEDLTVWLNRRIKEMVAARITQRSNTNQTEAPSMSGNSTSLVDQSSASDLVGVALNLAALSGASVDDKEATSASVTVTAYAVYAGFKGLDPLDPAIYFRNRGWRRLSLTLGYDKEEDSGSGAATDRATIYGAKFLIVNRRDGSHPCYWDPKRKCYSDAINLVSENLKTAAGGFSRIFDAVDKFLYEKTAAKFSLPKLENATKENRAAFRDEHLSDGVKFQDVIALLSSDDIKQLDRFIEEQIKPFEELQESSVRTIETIRRAPQFSLALNSKLRKEGADEYMGEAIFDFGVHPRVNFTANAAFEYRDNKTGPDNRGGKFALQWSIQATPEQRLQGRKPVSFNLAADGTWMSGMTPTYKGQIKFSIPIWDGVDFPLSLTFASRTDLVKEKEVRGQFGFTFDVSRLIAAVK